MRDLRTKGPQEQRSLQSLLAALGPVRSPDLSSLLDPTSGMSAVWSGQRKGALGRQGKGDVPAAVEFGRVAAAPVNTLRQQPHRCQEISVCF